MHSNAPAGHLRLYLNGEDHLDDFVLADGMWHHVAAVRTLPPEGEIRLYIDGFEVYSAPSGVGAYSVWNPTMLARDPRPDSHYFNGVIDEVRVWSIARDDEAIFDDMFIPLDGTEPGLAAYWRLDEGEGSAILDLVGAAEGMLVNGPEWYPRGLGLQRKRRAG